MTEEYLGIIEIDSSYYYHVVIDGNKLIAGTVTNTGFIPGIEIDYDADESMDDNLGRLYDAIVEAQYSI